MTCPSRVLLAAFLLVFRCPAQTPAEQLEKGIFAQETEGDLDAALQIYRQLTAAAPAQSAVGAQAQFRIAGILLQKGDLSGAATEFTVLATRYSEHQALIAKMAKRIGHSSNQSAGTVQDGRYRNRRTGVEVLIAAPWKLAYDGPSSDNGDMLSVSDGSPTEFSVWMRPETSTPSEIPNKLQASPAAKVKMNGDLPGFSFRPESIQTRIIGGQQALTAIADYNSDGQKFAAIYTWIFTSRNHVAFISRGIPASDLPGVQIRFDQFVASTMVP